MTSTADRYTVIKVFDRASGLFLGYHDGTYATKNLGDAKRYDPAKPQSIKRALNYHHMAEDSTGPEWRCRRLGKPVTVESREVS